VQSCLLTVEQALPQLGHLLLWKRGVRAVLAVTLGQERLQVADRLVADLLVWMC
jgi:hypothetical protein